MCAIAKIRSRGVRRRSRRPWGEARSVPRGGPARKPARVHATRLGRHTGRRYCPTTGDGWPLHPTVRSAGRRTREKGLRLRRIPASATESTPGSSGSPIARTRGSPARLLRVLDGGDIRHAVRQPGTRPVPGASCERADRKCTFGGKPGGGWSVGTELRRPSTVRRSRRGGRGRADPPSGRGDTGPRGGARRRRADRRGPPRNVLLLHAYPRLSPPVVGVDEAFRATLEAESPFPVYFYTEYLDLSLFDGDAPQRELRALLRRKYESRNIDLIVAAGSRALRAALHNRAELFSGAPLVFLGVDRASVADLRLGHRRHGHLAAAGLGRDAGARAAPPARHPQGRRGGGVGARRSRLAGCSAPAARGPAATESRSATSRAARSSKSRSRSHRCRTNTIVLVGAFLRDATGQNFNTRDAIARIARASRVPVYVLQDHAVGTGSVGGHVVSFEAHGRIGARLALRVLSGERPDPTDVGTTMAMVDWRELHRWGLDERRLPAGSVVLFQEPSVWERHRWPILAAVALALPAERADRRPPRAPRPAPTGPACPRRAPALRDAPLRPVRHVRHRPRGGGGPTDRDRAPAPGGGSGRRPGDRGRALRLLRPGPGHTFLDPRGRGAPPPGDPGQRDAVDRVASSARDTSSDSRASRTSRRGGASIGRPSSASAHARPSWCRSSWAARSAGTLVVGTLRAERHWPDELVPRLRLLAAVFAGALARQQAERAVRESEERFHRMADSAPMMVWLSGRDGGGRT